MKRSDYEPISCALYSRYELSILRRQTLKVCWRARHGLIRLETLRPLDLRTRGGAEFMIARNLRGQVRVLRLDRIHLTRPLARERAREVAPQR